MLTVTMSDKRVMSLAERTVELGGRRAFWYTINDKIEPDSILKRIWIRASDLYQVRNERAYQTADYKNSQRMSVLDTIGG